MNRNDPQKSSSLTPDISAINAPASLKLSQKPRPSAQSPSHRLGFSRSKSFTKKDLLGIPEKNSNDKQEVSENNLLNSFVEEISDFNSKAIGSFNPKYVDFEQRLATSLDTLQAQVEKLQSMRDYADELAESFENQTAEVKETFDKDLAEIHKWQAPREKLEGMQRRVVQLKSILNTSKDTLLKIDGELTQAEQDSRNRSLQVKNKMPNRQVLLLALVVSVAYYYLFR